MEACGGGFRGLASRAGLQPTAMRRVRFHDLDATWWVDGSVQVEDAARARLVQLPGPRELLNIGQPVI